MNAFNKRGFAKRFEQMGDEAEDVFDNVYPKHHRLGINRYWADGGVAGLAGVPAVWRYIPDRFIRIGAVEVMGIGRDRILKLKDEKLAALYEWDQLGPTWLFVWDNKARQTFLARIPDWIDAIEEFGTANEFHDGKRYMALHVDHFPVEGVPYAAPEQLSLEEAA